MHYDEFAFSKNRHKTLKANRNFKILPGDVLSDTDIEEVRKLYNCNSQTFDKKEGLFNGKNFLFKFKSYLLKCRN
jgi:hypothetical protein